MTEKKDLEKVYVETTVIGYLTSWPREDLTVRGHQESTREWWKTAGNRFRLVVSELVIQECSEGDEEAVKERGKALEGLTPLPTTPEAEALAKDLILSHAVPGSEPEDALHIALAAVHGINYLVTWNLRHIANASVRTLIESLCREGGYTPPVICTPEELMEP